MEKLLKKMPGKIIITSGERDSDRGFVKTYTGKHTQRAIKAWLTKERCGGDRWASAKIYSHESNAGEVFVNLETGELCAY